MYCSNCGNQIDNNSKFCPFCGAQPAATGAERLFPGAGTNEQASGNGQAYNGQPHGGQPRQSYNGQPRQAQPRQAYGGQPRQAQPRQAYNGQARQAYGGQPRQVQPAQNGFAAFLNGSQPMGPMPLISLIMFCIYGTFLFVNTFSFTGVFYMLFGFVHWFSFIMGVGVAAMFIVAYFNRSNRRLFFLIGCAALSLLYTIRIFRGFWFFIVFGLLLLGCVGVIVVYYVLEGRIINYRIKMLGCIGLMLFSFLQLILSNTFVLTLLYMVPYVALALGLWFYSPYVNRQ